MAVGDNGHVLDAWRREVPLALTDQTFQLIQEHGIVVTVRTAAKEPGPYQMRAAVEDLGSKTVGSAAQFLEVPQVGGGRLALSGVLLKGVPDPEHHRLRSRPMQTHRLGWRRRLAGARGARLSPGDRRSMLSRSTTA